LSQERKEETSEVGRKILRIMREQEGKDEEDGSWGETAKKEGRDKKEHQKRKNRRILYMKGGKGKEIGGVINGGRSCIN